MDSLKIRGDHKMILKMTQEEMREIAIDFLDRDKFYSIFEMGCGPGTFAHQLYMENLNFTYIGVDIQVKHITHCLNNNPDTSTFSFYRHDILIPYYDDFFHQCDVIFSFQMLEHLGTIGGTQDIELIERIPRDKLFIFSVPNSPYKNAHMRWYELDGWVDRYKHLLDFDNKITIQNPRKPKKRSFLFKTWRK